jgi:hypothetical protein
MPQNKDLKHLVRTRMKKTGEAYTTARAQIMKKSGKRSRTTAMPATYAKLAGMSNDSVKAKTGCSWEKWVKALDHHGAAGMSHRDIAKLVAGKYKVDGWWAQAVTVGYERIRGLRERGQRRDGGFEVNVSRTFPVPVGILFDAWKSSATRKRFLDGAEVKVRSARSPRSMRLEMEDGGIVALWFTDKGSTKSSVAVQHLQLPDRAAAEQSKRLWAERLDALKVQLAS